MKPIEKSSESAGTRSRDWSDREIRAFVADLQSLQGGRLAAAALAGCGPRAIPPLRDFLLGGLPQSLFQPRQLAVETLAELGAKDVLLEYLEQSKQISDPVVRHGEEAVESTAARELARWRTDDVYHALRALAEKKLLPGIVEALGSFRKPEMARWFLEAVEDDVCRAAAEEALRGLGEAARLLLLDAALRAVPSDESESPSSRIRRRAALRLLAELKLPVGDWKRLEPLLDEPDPAISLSAAQIALAIAPREMVPRAFQRLLWAFSAGDGFLRLEAKSLLARNFALLRRGIEAEISRRSKKPERERRADLVLRALLSVYGEAARQPGERIPRRNEPRGYGQ